jgi:hypothetical protein
MSYQMLAHPLRQQPHRGFSMQRIGRRRQTKRISGLRRPEMFSKAAMNANDEETQSSHPLMMLDIYAVLIRTLSCMSP